MKIYSLIVLVFFIGCKNHKTPSYPKVIKERGLENIYDESKWKIYSLNSEILGLTEESLDTISLIECDFELEYFDFIQDTTILYFSPKKEGYRVESINRPWFHTLAFKEDKIVYALFEGGLYWYAKELEKYYEPKEKYLFQYIKEHENNINSWLYKEYKKRKIE